MAGKLGNIGVLFSPLGTGFYCLLNWFRNYISPHLNLFASGLPRKAELLGCDLIEFYNAFRIWKAFSFNRNFAQRINYGFTTRFSQEGCPAGGG